MIYDNEQIRKEMAEMLSDFNSGVEDRIVIQTEKYAIEILKSNLTHDSKEDELELLKSLLQSCVSKYSHKTFVKFRVIQTRLSEKEEIQNTLDSVEKYLEDHDKDKVVYDNLVNTSRRAQEHKDILKNLRKVEDEIEERCRDLLARIRKQIDGIRIKYEEDTKKSMNK